MSIFAKMAADDYEEVVFFQDKVTGLRTIVAIHNTALGPAMGGTRMLPYASEDEALTDVLSLARAMTYKSAVAGLDVGGGKAVIIADPTQDKSEALLRAYARFIHSLGGRYFATTDVGTSTADIDILRRETPYVVGCSPAFGGSGDTSILTGFTVYLGMRATVKEMLGRDSLANLRIAVQGVGKVGWHLMEQLAKEGCHLIVTDVNAAAVEQAVRKFAARAVPPDDIYDVECDVFSPNALGAVLNATTIPRLRCHIVCGGANNPLAEEQHADELVERGILFAPDFVVNCGGIINAAEELWGYNAARAEARAQTTYETTLRVFDLARKLGVNPYKAAECLAEERIQKVSAIRHFYLPSPPPQSRYL
jgi:leucine dehydrogenase